MRRKVVSEFVALHIRTAHNVNIPYVHSRSLLLALVFTHF